MKILLLSAYDADSHRRWCNTLMAAFEEHEWTSLVLPPRHFNWRIRGNSLSWAFGEKPVLDRDYQLIIATSMVDLSALRGFVPALGSIPTLVYFHENQFAYPQSSNQFSAIEPCILNLYTALAADSCVFNSRYNDSSFFLGADALLNKLPDGIPKGIVEHIRQKSSVLAVPLESRCFHQRKGESSGPLSVIWNHRWEYDKAPERLFSGLRQALEKGASLELHVVGQRFRRCPDVFAEMHSYLQRSFPGVLKTWGYVECEEAYRELLSRSDVVLSTALHDFQGLSVMEAVAAGCIPLVPARLCYGEWFDERYQYTSSIDNPLEEASSLGSRLVKLSALKSQRQLPESVDLQCLSMGSLRPHYEEIFRKTIDRHSKLSG